MSSIEWIYPVLNNINSAFLTSRFTHYVVTKITVRWNAALPDHLVVAFALMSTKLFNFLRKPRGEHGVNVNVLHSDTFAA